MIRDGKPAPWEPDYDRGTGVYESLHTPPMFIALRVDDDDRMQSMGLYKTRAEAEERLAWAEEFNRKLWVERAEELAATGVHGPKLVTPDFDYWTLGTRKTGEFRGMGGRTFRIRFNDGEVVECSDLWSGGTIPVRYRSLFVPNGRFVNGESWVDVGSMRAFG